MSLKVLLLYGGLSSEREVSISTAKGIEKALLNLGYQVEMLDMDRDFIQKILVIHPDVVFNALHGTYGEDGCVPGALEIIGIPYTHSGVLASAIAMDKPLAKKLFEYSGIKTPKGLLMSRDEILAKQSNLFPVPYVVKPSNEGSSVGVHIVKENSNFFFTEENLYHSKEFLVEEFIPGKEISVAVINDKAIGVLELKPAQGFYDYEAKYTDGKTIHVMPAEIPDDKYQQVMQMAEKAHKLLGCKTISRSDFRYNPENGELYILEVNTHPGMTPLSIVPEIAAYCGVSYEDIVEMLIRSAYNKN